MIKETDGDSYEKLRSLNQNLTFNYTEQIFKENNSAIWFKSKKDLGFNRRRWFIYKSCFTSIWAVQSYFKSGSIWRDREKYI